MSSGASPSPTDNHSEYPPQRHAGAVGYGPEYGKGAVCLSVFFGPTSTNEYQQSTGDKLEGLKEELKGKIMHEPDLVQHGHDLRTGELKRKAFEDDNVRLVVMSVRD